jgi:hypothetical protein
MERKFIPTSEKIEIKDYPYGFRLRTTLYDTIEFAPKKGYRHCTQTIDPRNGRLNAPKKSTYAPLLVRYYNEDNHIKTIGFDFTYSTKDRNKGCKFISENFDLFKPEEIKYFYGQILSGLIIEWKSMIVYCGADSDKVKEVLKPYIDIAKKGLSDGLNHFENICIDESVIDALKDPTFNPFSVRTVNIG